LPPVTTRYRFYVTCDDSCNLDIAEGAGSTGPLTRLKDVGSFTDYRSYFSANRGQWKISEWVNLTMGEEYYMRGKIVE